MDVFATFEFHENTKHVLKDHFNDILCIREILQNYGFTVSHSNETFNFRALSRSSRTRLTSNDSKSSSRGDVRARLTTMPESASLSKLRTSTTHPSIVLLSDSPIRILPARYALNITLPNI